MNTIRRRELIRLTRDFPAIFGLPAAVVYVIPDMSGMSLPFNTTWVSKDITLKKVYSLWLLHKSTPLLNNRLRVITGLLGRNPRHKSVKWMWRGYQHRISNRKASDLLWRIRHNSLPIGSRLRHWGIPDVFAEFCNFCPDVHQSHSHLFWNCPIANRIWSTVGIMATIAWPDWRLCSPASNYEDILWGMSANGFTNKTAAQAWDCYVECTLRAIWISRCNSKMSNKGYSVAIVISTFLALLATVLETVLMDYRT